MSVLDARSGKQSHRITVGNGPGNCAIDPVTGRLLVSNAGSGTLTVVDRPWSAPSAAGPAAHPAAGRPLPHFALPDLRTGKIRRTGEYAARLGIRGVPCNVIVDARGVVRTVGATTPGELEREIGALLAED